MKEEIEFCQRLMENLYFKDTIIGVFLLNLMVER